MRGCEAEGRLWVGGSLMGKAYSRRRHLVKYKTALGMWPCDLEGGFKAEGSHNSSLCGGAGVPAIRFDMGEKQH